MLQGYANSYCRWMRVHRCRNRTHYSYQYLDQMTCLLGTQLRIQGEFFDILDLWSWNLEELSWVSKICWCWKVWSRAVWIQIQYRASFSCHWIGSAHVINTRTMVLVWFSRWVLLWWLSWIWWFLGILKLGTIRGVVGHHVVTFHFFIRYGRSPIRPSLVWGFIGIGALILIDGLGMWTGLLGKNLRRRQSGGGLLVSGGRCWCWGLIRGCGIWGP